jgi:diadenosine tetraphosphate (Ap4A) HIT family hydrolase
MLTYEDLIILKGTYWTVFLHGQSPYYLGRMYIWLKRDVVDLMDISREERDELFVIGQKLKEALAKLSHPDLFNYAALGNESPHVHVHLVPRYAGAREFDGITFSDDQWGSNYVPFDRQFSVPDETLIKLRDTIRDLLDE